MRITELIHLISWIFIFIVGATAGEEFAAQDIRSVLDSLDDDIEWIQAEAVIFSVSKKEEKLFAASAAAFVITREDIRRSGVTNIPDALRMVPGVNVAQIDANKWAISVRGFNDRFSNKLLVLIDGRSIYTTAFSGVYWEIHDLIMEDVERIEIIRGPGATLWGANAVNGVINIITRNSKDTRGVFAEAGGGNQEQGFGSFRFGGNLGDDATFRLYGKTFNRDSYHDDTTRETDDDWRLGMGGLRIDWDLSPQDHFMLQGGFNSVTTGTSQALPNRALTTFDDIPTEPETIIENDDAEFDTLHLLGRWEREISENQDFSLQLYYDRYSRDDNLQQFQDSIDTVDLDFQHRFTLLEDHEVVWGTAYRVLFVDFDNSVFLNASDPERTIDLVSAFVQDRWTLIPDRLSLTAGSKFEYNDLSGVEIQPGVRFVWTPSPQQTVWASVARAVRTPSIVDDDLKILSSIDPIQVETEVLNLSDPTMPIPGIVQGINTTNLQGDGDFDSEELIAYECGFRLQVNEGVTFDIAAFYNDYSNLRTGDVIVDDPILTGIASSPGMVPIVIDAISQATISLNNNMSGETYGVELAANWAVTEYWRLAATYSYLEIQLHNRAFSSNELIESDEGRSPENQATLRSHLDLPWNLEFDTGLYYVDSIIGGTQGRFIAEPGIASNLRLDARIGWRPNENIELSLVAQNLGDNQHREFSRTPDNINSAEVKRSVYVALKCRF